MNWGRLRADWDDPLVAEFADNVDRVNALSERCPGFVWRMDGDTMFAAQQDPEGMFGGDPRVASTLSVWESLEHLKAFIHKTVHHHFMAKGRDWFESHDRPSLVMWYVPVGHRPTMDEAKARLEHLETFGDSDVAFGMGYCAAKEYVVPQKT